MSMNKSDIALRLWEEGYGKTQKDAQDIVTKVFEVITIALVQGSPVMIKGFGKLEPVTRKARVGRDMNKNISVNIPERRQVRFVAGTPLFKQLNK